MAGKATGSPRSMKGGGLKKNTIGIPTVHGGAKSVNVGAKTSVKPAKSGK